MMASDAKRTSMNAIVIHVLMMRNAIIILTRTTARVQSFTWVPIVISTISAWIINASILLLLLLSDLDKSTWVIVEALLFVETITLNLTC